MNKIYHPNDWHKDWEQHMENHNHIKSVKGEKMKQIIKRCLLNVIAACEKYNVPFDGLLTEISSEIWAKKADEIVKGKEL